MTKTRFFTPFMTKCGTKSTYISDIRQTRVKLNQNNTNGVKKWQIFNRIDQSDKMV